jgi:hypothetical protein
MGSKEVLKSKHVTIRLISGIKKLAQAPHPPSLLTSQVNFKGYLAMISSSNNHFSIA